MSGDRLNRAENDVIDLKLAVSALIETGNRHQLNFEASQRNFDRIYAEILNLRTESHHIQAEIRGLQTENRRILDILQQRDEEDDANPNSP